MCVTKRSQRTERDKKIGQGSAAAIVCDLSTVIRLPQRSGRHPRRSHHDACSVYRDQLIEREPGFCSRTVLWLASHDDHDQSRRLEVRSLHFFAQISSSPPWTPEAGEPPLALSKAVQLATEWAKKEYKRFDGVQVRSINVTAYGCPAPKDRWYYTVHFAPIMDTIPLLVPGYFVAVLMDGTIIGPTTVK